MLTRTKVALLIIICCFSTVLSQYTNVRISNPSSTNPEEVTIAINPSNPLNLAAGANINYFYYSMDGGQAWTQGQLSSTFGVWGDPSVVFDASGNLYFGHLSNPPSPGYWIDRIVVQKSTNGGQTWSSGNGIGYNPPRLQQDKEWLGVDMTGSPYHNNVYLAWTEFDEYGSTLPSDSTRILFSRSTDAGATWSFPVKVSDVSGNCIDEDNTVEGAVPAIGPNGEVYLSWAGPLGIMFDKSTDGGQTWGADVFVTQQPGGWDFGVSGIYRANGLPITACDVSNSPHRGNIYVQWTDQRNGVDNTDVFIIKSTNGGQTWGSTVRVNDDTTSRQQFFSWMTVDQTSGNLYVVFYDRRNTIGDTTDVYVAKSSDGGETFTNFKVSATAFKPRSNIFFGDYTNIAAYAGKVYPIWMRMDGTALSVWTALITDTVSTIAKVPLPLAEGWNLISVPVALTNYAKTALFPSAISNAYTFHSGYSVDDTLAHGIGYWVKFASSEIDSFVGQKILVDSIPVDAKWNMVGSLSSTVAVTNIGSDPPGLVASDFYYYTGGSYMIADSIKPGFGYWVKTNATGRLILTSTGMISPQNHIKIRHINELPPPPPSIEREENFPKAFALEQNYPNPFNPKTVVRYQLPVQSMVSVKVYNMLGQEISILVNEMKRPGSYTVTWDAGNMPSGVYFYKMTAGNFVDVKRMVVIK